MNLRVLSASCRQIRPADETSAHLVAGTVSFKVHGPNACQKAKEDSPAIALLTLAPAVVQISFGHQQFI
jgi:hypothetical protein